MRGIFLDTGKIEEIRKFTSMGIVRGVTTNPTILVKEGIASSMESVRKCCIEIAKMIDPLPLSVEVTNNNPILMREQVLDFAQWGPNINVKIPIHGPNGEIENLQLIHEFETRLNVRINVTAMMSAQQCFLAAMAGATYVSIFAGRINDMGYDSRVEIEKLRKMLNAASLPAQIIAASCREAVNVEQWFEAGAHIVTVPPDILQKLIVHPYSKETVQQFVRDGAKFEQQAKEHQQRMAS